MFVCDYFILRCEVMLNMLFWFILLSEACGYICVVLIWGEDIWGELWNLIEARGMLIVLFIFMRLEAC